MAVVCCWSRQRMRPRARRAAVEAGLRERVFSRSALASGQRPSVSRMRCCSAGGTSTPPSVAARSLRSRKLRRHWLGHGRCRRGCCRRGWWRMAKVKHAGRSCRSGAGNRRCMGMMVIGRRGSSRGWSERKVAGCSCVMMRCRKVGAGRGGGRDHTAGRRHSSSSGRQEDGGASWPGRPR